MITPDALLVADKARAQDVSASVGRPNDLNRKEQAQHLRNYRPLGLFRALSLGSRFQVKLLHANLGARLVDANAPSPLRALVVVSSTAKVTIRDCTKLVQDNESVYVTATARLESPGKVTSS